jgi:hypothetical protein
MAKIIAIFIVARVEEYGKMAPWRGSVKKIRKENWEAI